MKINKNGSGACEAMEETTPEDVPYFCPSCEFESESHNLVLRHRLWAHGFGFKEHGSSVENIERDRETSFAENKLEHEIPVKERCAEKLDKFKVANVELEKGQSKGDVAYKEKVDKDNINNFAIMGNIESGAHKSEPIISDQNIDNNLLFKEESSGEKENVEKQKGNNKINIKEEIEEEQFDCQLPEEENQNRLVRCSLCPQTYSTYHAKESLRKHMKIKHSTKRHVCDTCGKDFPSACYLKRHNDGVHLGKILNKTSTQFKCPQCKYSTHRRENLNDHNSVTHLGSNFNCTECSKSYSNSRNLKFHISKNHQGKEPEYFKCGSCEYKSGRKETLKLHIQAKHQDERHLCDLCKKTFSTEKCLRRHTRVDHLNLRHSCKTCDKTFSLRSNRNAHMEVHHERKQYICSFCPYLSNSKIIQNKHFKIFHPGKTLPYPEICHVCKICGCQKNSRQYLREHIRKAHEGTNMVLTKKKYFPCTECKRILYRQYTSCLQHSCAECNNRSFTKSFINCVEHDLICDNCGFVTRNLDRLKKHKVSKSCNLSKAKKSHKCGVCHMWFTTERYMKKHEEQHTKGKPYKCDYCELRFTQKFAIKKHLESGICPGFVKTNKVEIIIENNVNMRNTDSVNINIASNVKMGMTNNVYTSQANNVNKSITNNDFINISECLT